MGPKKGKKGGKKASGGSTAVDASIDELDAVLNEFTVESKVEPTPASSNESAPAPASATEPSETSEVDAAAAAYLASLGVDPNANIDKSKDKKKKKGKKGKGGDASDKKDDSKKPTSAAAKALMERQAALKAEQERLEKERLEQERIEKEEEAKRIAEKERLEEIRRKKKEAKAAKIERQKKEGTYMTKAQKQKAARAQEALEAMQLAGLVPSGAAGEEKKKVVYSNNKRRTSSAAHKQNHVEVEEVEEDTGKKGATTEAQENESKASTEDAEEVEEEEEAEAPNDWDDEDWETSDILASLEDKINGDADAQSKLEDEVEDLLVLEQMKEQERLRLQGIAMKKRQEELEEQARLDEIAEKQRSKAQQEAERKKKEAADRRRIREEEARANVSEDNLRSPICCIMGHVDTGKTKLLDNIRKTKVQDGEAGGITQQIGATFFPVSAIQQKTARLIETTTHKINFRLPGLLVIDTPGHESFTNLRSRGSSLCDIAILVVDIMHGLEPQTLESLRLLRQKKAPFVVALNKIDRCYGWKTMPDMPIQEALKYQSEHVIREFEDRAQKIMVEFAEQKINAEIYWRNKDLGHVVSLIPTSAISGEGVQDLLYMLVRLTQEKMAKSLAFVDILQCTVLEVKVIEGLGTTIDTVLVNGSLREGDTIVVCTLEGPVVTTIRSLLTPHPMKEMRVKGDYLHHAYMKAAMGVKICANGLEKAVAGTQIYVVGPDDDVEELKDSVMSDLTGILDSVKSTKRGVMVQASTLGALEALLEFLRTCEPPIPVACVNLGPVHKKDVMRASVQLEHQREYATILAFDVKVHPDATELANELGVKIFTAEIIYHLFDQFTAYMDNFRAIRRQEVADIAVFPCVLSIVPSCIFNKKDPIILGVDVEEGILKIGTPLVVPSAGMLLVGRVGSIEKDHKEVDRAKKGSSVAVRIDNEGSVMYGRHFQAPQKLVSRLSRESIDALKENFREDLQKEDWQLVIKLKKVFDII